MGFGRKILGTALTAIGTVTGIAPLAAAGVGLSATSGLGNKSRGGAGASVPAVTHSANLAPGPPMSASSLDMARGQDKSRMKRQYGL